MSTISYNLAIVIKWLRKHKVQFETVNSLVDTGCLVTINQYYYLSIQTDPAVAGSSFAELAIASIKHNRLVYNVAGYGDVVRCKSPEDLFNHIRKLILLNPVEKD